MSVNCLPSGHFLIKLSISMIYIQVMYICVSVVCVCVMYTRTTMCHAYIQSIGDMYTTSISKCVESTNTHTHTHTHTHTTSVMCLPPRHHFTELSIISVICTQVMYICLPIICVCMWCIHNAHIDIGVVYTTMCGAYRVAKNYRMPYLYRTFSAKGPCN